MAAPQPADYQPFPIADFRAGIDLQREPWLTPPNAWSELEDCHIFRGRLWKRLGYEVFGELAIADVHTLTGSSGDSTIDSATYGALNPIVKKGLGGVVTYVVKFDDGGTQEVWDDGNGDLWRQVAGEFIGAGGGYAYSGTLAKAPLTPGNLVFVDIGGTVQTITFDEIGEPHGDFDPWHYIDFDSYGCWINWTTGEYEIHFASVTTGTINAWYRTIVGSIDYDTGAYSFTLVGPAANDMTCDYEYRRLTIGATQNAVMGLPSYFPLSGNEHLFAFDRARHWKWHDADQEFKPQAPLFDLWTGEAEDFFRTTYIDDRLVITNGVDPLTYRDASSLEEVHTDFDKTIADPPASPPAAGWTEPGNYARNIGTAFLVFTIKNRLVLLRTREDFGAGMVWRPQRARWSKVNPNLDEGTDSWDINDYKDASTQDWIVGAAMNGEELIVWFERSVWKLVWKDDFRDPFEWVRISPLYGSIAPMSPIQRERDIVAVGQTSMLKCDGETVDRHGHQIHDTPTIWNSNSLKYSYGARVDEQRGIWHTYTRKSDEFPGNILVYNYEDDAFSTYKLPFHCFGRSTQVGVILWDDILPSWNLTSFPFDLKAISTGFPLVLAGSRDGRVFKLLSSQSDLGGVIPFRAKTSRLNPYQSSNRPMQMARLGYVDIVASANSAVYLTLKFMADFSDAPYKTTTFGLGGGAGEDKVVRRFLVNRTARWHRIEIAEISNVNFAIDAVIPWFQPDGDMGQMAGAI